MSSQPMVAAVVQTSLGVSILKQTKDFWVLTTPLIISAPKIIVKPQYVKISSIINKNTSPPSDAFLLFTSNILTIYGSDGNTTIISKVNKFLILNSYVLIIDRDNNCSIYDVTGNDVLIDNENSTELISILTNSINNIYSSKNTLWINVSSLNYHCVYNIEKTTFYKIPNSISIPYTMNPSNDVGISSDIYGPATYNLSSSLITRIRSLHNGFFLIYDRNQANNGLIFHEDILTIKPISKKTALNIDELIDENYNVKYALCISYLFNNSFNNGPDYTFNLSDMINPLSNAYFTEQSESVLFYNQTTNKIAVLPLSYNNCLASILNIQQILFAQHYIATFIPQMDFKNIQIMQIGRAFYIMDCITKKVYVVNIIDNMFRDLNNIDLNSIGNPFVFSE